MRASVSATDAAAISEYGPPSWKAASVREKLTHVNRGRGHERPRYVPLQMPQNCSTAVWSISDDHLYSFTGRTNRWVEWGSSSAGGGRSIGSPARISPKIEWSAPTSHGSFTDTVTEPGTARATAW